MTAPPKHKMTVDEYLAWAQGQPGRLDVFWQPSAGNKDDVTSGLLHPVNERPQTRRGRVITEELNLPVLFVENRERASWFFVQSSR